MGCMVAGKREGTGAERVGNRELGAHALLSAPIYPSFDFFGLWSVRFPPVLVRTGRRLPVQALGERRVLVAVTGYPRLSPKFVHKEIYFAVRKWDLDF